MSEQLLYEVLAEAYNKEFADFDNAPRHRFSHSHKVKMRRLFDGDTAAPTTKPRIKLKYVWIAIILACVLALAGFTCYYILNRFSFKVYKDHSVVEYLDIKNAKQTLEEFYYLPETDELKIENEEVISISSIIQYNFKGSIITFEQELADVPKHINTEGGQVEPLMIGEHNGFFVDMSGETYICWAQDGYIFSLLGDINKETAIELAKTTRIK